MVKIIVIATIGAIATAFIDQVIGIKMGPPAISAIAHKVMYMGWGYLFISQVVKYATKQESDSGI